MNVVPPLRFALFCVLFLLCKGSFLSAQAQDRRCGTDSYRSSPQQLRFEQWMQEKINKKQLQTLRVTDDEPIYRIPVVVHVVHRGEAVGEGSNIPLEQIQDQIRILNEDFRRLNADTINTPEIFEPVATDTRIEFVLAQQDEDGFPTNGVVRIEGNQPSYGQEDAEALGILTQWRPDLYMNIWVTTVRSPILGYAQLPVSDLPGLEGSSQNSLTDGVVIDYLSFGSIGALRDRYNQGRTATHEVGHYLGLRHIWGDDENAGDDCAFDDFVEDTPNQAVSYNSCPVDAFSCESPDMYDNYMDLTDDVCMNIFTEGQKLRMRTVLENSIRRRSLLTSPGLEAPVPIADDATIARIINPQNSECSEEVVPRISLLNTGINEITSVTATFSVEEARVEETTFTLNLPPGELQEVTFSSVASEVGLTPGVFYEASFTITAVNGTVDDAPAGNTRSVEFVIPQRDEVPLIADFESDESDSFFEKSIVRNPDGQITWQRREAPNTADPGNDALFINFYDYEAAGERDFFYSPTLDLSNIPAAVLSFNVAYAPYVSEDGVSTERDGLLVGVSTDCGATVDAIIYEKFGEELATQPAQENPFAPVSEEDWREEIIPLNDYLGEPDVQLVFIGVNDHGNNVYLDDIEFFVTEYDSIRPAERSFNVEPKMDDNQLDIEFNLDQKDDLEVAVYSITGQLIDQYSFPGTLNQSYALELRGRPTGVYVVRVRGRTINETKKFLFR